MSEGRKQELDSVVGGAIKTDARRRWERKREQTARGDPLNTADFTAFMGSYHDQEQELVELQQFDIPEDLASDIERSIKRSKHNKAPGRDGVQNEMLKENPGAISTLLAETWVLIGKGRKYTDEWKQGILTPILKKGERALPQNYRSVFMLYGDRKVRKAAIAERIASRLPIFGCNFGSREGFHRPSNCWM